MTTVASLGSRTLTVGGLGSVAGPLIGATPVQVLITWLQKYGEWDMVIFAVIVIALMRTHSGGINAFAAALGARFRAARTSS